MKPVFYYIRDYLRSTSIWVLLLSALFTGILVLLNYSEGLDARISAFSSLAERMSGRAIIFFVALLFPYLLYRFQRKRYTSKILFWKLALAAVFIFSLKAGVIIDFPISSNAGINNYWNHVIYWPLLLFMTLGLLWICWRLFNREQPFYGISTRNMTWKPYWLMLIIMAPLIALAATQHDFQAMYPKLRHITDFHSGFLTFFHKLLFELSYGSDFISIEVFFRGFLVLAFVKIAGKDAILPMACFYCTIHFGKPLGECISSFFGGMLLGIVVYNTRSIFGGLMVHLGIAWMMELAGYLAS